MSPTPYRHICEGEGGVLHFRDETVVDSLDGYMSPEIHDHVGTYGCITCVGIYFEIDKKKCFAAHINSWIKRDREDQGLRALTPAEGERLKNEVLKRFRECAEEHKWDPTDKQTHANIVATLLLVCPRYNITAYNPIKREAREQAAHYVVKAIREFLRVTEAQSLVDTASQGFVVRHPRGKREKFAWEDAAWDGMPPLGIVDYVRKTDPINDGKWYLVGTP